MATPGKPLPDQTKRSIRRLDAAGWTVRAIADQLCVSKTTVQKYVHESGTTSQGTSFKVVQV